MLGVAQRFVALDPGGRQRVRGPKLVTILLHFTYKLYSTHYYVKLWIGTTPG